MYNSGNDKTRNMPQSNIDKRSEGDRKKVKRKKKKKCPPYLALYLRA